jgi:hypothetical protein
MIGQSQDHSFNVVGEVPYNKQAQAGQQQSFQQHIIGADKSFESRSLISNSCTRHCLVLDTKFVVVIAVAIALFAEQQ